MVLMTHMRIDPVYAPSYMVLENNCPHNLINIEMLPPSLFGITLIALEECIILYIKLIKNFETFFYLPCVKFEFFLCYRVKTMCFME